MAVKRIEPLELSELLGSLMSSVVTADAASARTTVDFISDVGFEDVDDADGTSRRLRMVSLRYDKRDENDDIATFEVQVPLLSLVNVPRLSIEEATFSMAYDVVSVVSADGQPADVSPALGRATAAKLPVLKGLVRARRSGTSSGERRDQERTTTSVDVDVTLRLQPIPVGVERLFDLADLGITESRVDQTDGDGDGDG